LRRLAIIPLLLIVSVLLIFAIQQKKTSDQLPDHLIYSSGTVEAKAITLTAQVTGKVISKKYRRGDYVDSGDTLLLLEDDLFQARLLEIKAGVKATEAELAAAEIELANAGKNLDRSRRAYESGSLPESEFDNIKSSVDAGAQQVEALRSRLGQLDAMTEELKLQRGYTVIIAPLSGYIQSAPVDEAELALPGSALFEIIDLTDSWVEIYVSEAEIAFVNVGDSAEVYLDAFPDKPIPGVVSFISHVAEFTPKNVQTRKERVKQVFAVRVKVDNSDRIFKPGLPVDVYLFKNE